MKVEYTKNLKNYELKHWKSIKDKSDVRSNIMSQLFPDVDVKKIEIATDVGCGPHCGIFSSLTFKKMYAVDPLWDEYINNKLEKIPQGVQIIKSDGETFKLIEKSDVIFSFNSLDHSGDLKKSFDNIMSNLSNEGTFYFHIHMRTESQLNEGHRMAIKEEFIDSILEPYEIVSKRIEEVCPLDNKNYRSYIAIVKHK